MSEVSISIPRSYPIFVDKSFQTKVRPRLTYANAARAVDEGIPRVHFVHRPLLLPSTWLAPH